MHNAWELFFFRADIDGALDYNHITGLIREHRYSLFRTVGYTERPGD